MQLEHYRDLQGIGLDTGKIYHVATTGLGTSVSQTQRPDQCCLDKWSCQKLHPTLETLQQLRHSGLQGKARLVALNAVALVVWYWQRRRRMTTMLMFEQEHTRHVPAANVQNAPHDSDSLRL